MGVNEAVDPVLDALLDRSEAFEAAMAVCFTEAGYVLAVSDQRHELVAAACDLCIEHARVVRASLAIGAPNSGAAVLRIQYEALLRAAWVLFAASPLHIEKLSRALDLEAEQAAKNVPSYMDMLEAIEKKAPEGLAAPLAEFNQYSRHALNSFVHSGIHPLSRARDGFPPEMSLTIVRFSNGLLHLAYRILASLSGSQQLMARVTSVHLAFPECVPGLAKAKSG